MTIRQADAEDAKDIAKLYIAAFPESIGRFFSKKPQLKLLELLESVFTLIFAWGGDGLVIIDKNDKPHGYCLYSTKKAKPCWQRPTKFLKQLAKIVSRISPPEIGRLVQNQFTIFHSTKKSEKISKPEARILSIAICPTYQGQGAGTLLFQAALRKLDGKSVALNVRTENLPACRLYARTGFQKYGHFRDRSGKWQMLIRN